MKFKSLSVFLSLLIITVLPFTAYAVGPASDESDNPVIADDGAPYVTTTITDNDRGHIATTAYVKGAYNDTIAAVNNVASNVEDAFVDIKDVDDRLELLIQDVDNKRVEIYTTWGGNGTAEVAFINATPQQQGGGGKL